MTNEEKDAAATAMAVVLVGELETRCGGLVSRLEALERRYGLPQQGKSSPLPSVLEVAARFRAALDGAA